MIEQIIKWLKDGNELKAANLVAECSLNYVYVDLVFEFGSERDWVMYDVNIEAPRKILMSVENSPKVKGQIEQALRDFASQSGKYIRNIYWIPKLSPITSAAEDQITTFLAKVDTEHIQKVWEKALSRKSNDPDGAITAARSLVETVCKHILDKSNTKYPDDADLPKLYYLVAEYLTLTPGQYTDKTIKKVLGNCQSVIDGLANLRNEFGDAHGKSQNGIKPDVIHAELAVNLAGAMAIFLVSIFEKSITER